VIPRRGDLSLAPQAVVLAGGLGTRMRPRTERVPKCLLEVGGRPLLAWTLDALRASGFRRVVLCVGHLGDEVERFAGDGLRHGLDVRYAHERGPLLGTAGAIAAARALLAEAFVVTYGDSFLPFDYLAPLRALEAAPAADGAMAVWRNDGALAPSNARVEQGLVTAYDKTRAGQPGFSFIDYGALALRRSIFDGVPPGAPLGLERVQADLAARGKLVAVEAFERFYEIGSPDGLAELDNHLAGARFVSPSSLSTSFARSHA